VQRRVDPARLLPAHDVAAQAVDALGDEDVGEPAQVGVVRCRVERRGHQAGMRAVDRDDRAERVAHRRPVRVGPDGPPAARRLDDLVDDRGEPEPHEVGAVLEVDVEGRARDAGLLREAVDPEVGERHAVVEQLLGGGHEAHAELATAAGAGALGARGEGDRHGASVPPGTSRVDTASTLHV
jgi:hypothetical protein